MITKSGYDLVADEYYNKELHPTCANFRELSKLLLWQHIKDISPKCKILEIGVGKSLAGEILLEKHRIDMNHLTMIDSSARMLEYSSVYREYGAKLTIGNAEDIPEEPKSVDIVISSLGDPYNTQPFWCEVARVLKPEGICIFTTPSYEWASKFRINEAPHISKFQVDDNYIDLPSFVLDSQAQHEMFCGCGLRVVKQEFASVSWIKETPLSPKIACVLTDIAAPVLTAYIVKKK